MDAADKITEQTEEQAAARRLTRRWFPLLVILGTIGILATAAYDMLPNFTLEHRIDIFMDIARIGEPRQKVNSELAAKGFAVPEPDPPAWDPPAGGHTINYIIRNREPLLERVADRLALLGGFSKWYANKKPPHQALVSFDENDRISAIEFSSRFSPLGL